MQVKVSVTKTEVVTVNLTKEQIRDVANQETNLVLETLTKNARQAALLKYAVKVCEKSKSKFSNRSEFFIRDITKLYEKNGSYDYHNDFENDKYLGELTMTDLDEYKVTCAKIAEACSLLGCNANGK